ncbi:MAG: RsiV family protein [Rikenellaceae bacterium]
MMKNLFCILALGAALWGCSESVKPLVLVENAAVSKDSANVTVDINYPLVTDSRYAPLREAINGRVAQIVWDQTPRPYDPQNDDLRSITYEPDMDRPVSSQMCWTMCSGEKLVSVELGGYWFAGGAHGMSFHWVEHFDPTTGAKIQIRDYITDSVAFLDVVREELAADSIVLYPWVTDLMLPNNFLVDSISITAIYNQYDIAPYAAGILDIPIRFSQISGAVDTLSLAPSSIRTIHGK